MLDTELDQTSQSSSNNIKLKLNSTSEQSDLDFSSLRLSTPNLNIISSTPTSEVSGVLESQYRGKTAALGLSSPLAQRRARSTSSIQKEALLTKVGRNSDEMSKDKRYSAIFATRR